MYNKNEDGYPAPGAPEGMAIPIDGVRYRVCFLCAQMFISVAGRTYFIEAHADWVKEQTHRNKLRSGSNYLDK